MLKPVDSLKNLLRWKSKGLLVLVLALSVWRRNNVRITECLFLALQTFPSSSGGC